MKKKILVASICALLLLAACASVYLLKRAAPALTEASATPGVPDAAKTPAASPSPTLPAVPVASAGGVEYATLQEAVDAAARSETEAGRTVTLLCDVDLGGASLIAAGCDITLNLNGHAITGTAEALIVLREGASLVVEDAQAGGGGIVNTSGTGCAISVEDGELIINAGAVQTLAEGGAAVRRTEGSTVTVNGGSVGEVVSAGGAAETPNGEPEGTPGAPAAHTVHRGGTATCTEQAVCAECGKAYGMPLGHDFETYFTIDIEPLCYRAGLKSRHCARCHAAIDAALIPATGNHNFACLWTSAAEHWYGCTNPGCTQTSAHEGHRGGTATCTEQAKCAVCGVSYGALGHAFETEWTVDVKATCTEPGSKSHHCAICGAKADVTEILPTGHSYSPLWQTNPTEHWQVCTAEGCGAETPRAAHSGGAATCTEQAKCAACGAPYGAPLGHAFETEWTVDVEATCTVEGLERRVCLNDSTHTEERAIPIKADAHNWGEWATVTPATCAVEGLERRMCVNNPAHTEERAIPINPDAHSWSEWATVTPATCMEEGLERRACANNPAHIEERAIPIDPDAHNWGEWTTVTPATCTEEGLERRMCANNPAHTEERAIPIDPDAHRYSTAWANDAYGHYHRASCIHGGGIGYEAHTGGTATCTEKAVCSVCAAAYGKPLGHTYPETWLSDANEHWRACARPGCTETIDRAAHSGGTATCTQAAKCAHCGAPYGEALGHDWSAWTTTTPATCSKPGLQKRVCLTDSAHSETQAIPIDPNAHDWGAGVVTTRETCSAPGVRTFTCAHNGAHTMTTPIPSSEHTHTVYILPPVGCTLSVTAGGAPIENGTALPCGTAFIATAALSPGFEHLSLEANGATFTSGVPQSLRGADVTISARADVILHTVTFVKPEKGAFDVNRVCLVSHGSDISFAITPETGYGVRNVFVDGVAIGAMESGTLTNVTADHTVTAEVVKVYHITAEAKQNGQISPSGTTGALQGTDQTYVITPNPSCEIIRVIVDGVDVGAVTSYTFRNVTGNHEIVAYFKEDRHRITIGASLGGSVTPPQGITSVGYGQSLTVEMTPDAGYMVYDVTVDGTSVGRPANYTFSDNLDHTLFVEFRRFYTITTQIDSAGTGGALGPGGPLTVFEGESVTLDAVPNPGYAIDYMQVDGASYPKRYTCTFENVRRDHSVSVAFNPIITAIILPGGGGTISPAGSTEVMRGAGLTYTFTPSQGYVVKDVKVDGLSQGAINSFAFENVTAPHSVDVQFERLAFQIQATAGVRGTISPAGAVSVPWGGSQTFAITPDAGFAVKDVTVDGVSVGAVTTYKFTNVTGPHSIAATFVTAHRIDAIAAEGGTITPGGSTDVPSGGRQTYTITPNEGYHIAAVWVDGANKGAVGSYTFADVMIPHTIRAEFAKSDYTISFADNTDLFISAPATAQVGDTVELTVNPAEGWELAPGTLKINGAAISGTSFAMPAQNVVITAAFRQISYSITIETIGEGSITASHASATKGAVVTLTITQAAHYLIQPGSLQLNGVPFDGTYFTMPAADVRITATFESKVYAISIYQLYNRNFTDNTFERLYSTDRVFVCYEVPIEHFEGALVDGVAVDSSWYYLGVWEGNATVTFNFANLDTLAPGDHSFTLMFTSGLGNATLRVTYPKNGRISRAA